MHKQLLLSTLALSTIALAQSPCTPPNPSQPTTLTWPTTGTNIYTAYGQSTVQVAPYIGSTGYAIDINATANISLNGFSFQLFNDGDNAPATGPWCNLGTQTTFSPVLGPTTCTVKVWECATSWQGNATLPPGTGPWNLLGTATGTYTGPWGSQTAFTATTPMFLSAGQHGLIFEFVAVPGISCTQYNSVTTSYAPWGPMVKQSVGAPVYSDSFITLQNLAWQIDSFLSTPQTSVTIGTPPVTGFVDIPMTFQYTPASGAAYSNAYGQGCVFSPSSFREVYNAASPCDLSNHTISMFNLGTNYAVSVSPGAPAWFTPVSASLASATTTYQSSTSSSWDDAMTTPITLPWSFPYPGGSTNTIEINVNGLVCLQHDPDASAAFGFYDDLNKWRNKPANFAVCYGDADCSVNNTWTGPYGVYYDVDPSGNQVYITWITQEWSPAIGPTQTFQLMMDVSGNVEYRYQGIGMNAAPAPILVGWTPGNGVSIPDNTDLTSVGGFVTGDGSDRTTLALSARPITGTTINAVTSNIHTGSVLGLVMLGFGNLANGASLAPLGAPGCSQYIATVGTSLLFLTPTTAPASVSLPIPNNAALVGMTLGGQSLLLTPGVNGLGVLTSNGLCIGVGSF